MTTSHPTEPPALTWAELDLLADWSVGELAGPEADRIAALVQSDPAWARAYAQLVDAQSEVASWLANAADATAGEPMPADVAARLDAALSAAALTDAHPRSPITASPAPGHGASRRPPARPRGDTASRPPRSAGPRRRPAMAVLAVAAMALVVLGGFAVFRDLLGAGTGGQFAATEGASADNGPEVAGPPAEPTVRGQISLWASGTDYQAETLASFPNVRLPALAPDSPDLLSSPLTSLATESGLRACLAAVEARYAGQVTAADFARYEGQPALILLIQRPQGPLVVAVGDDCGRAGADEKAAVLPD